jgi:prevent-host-death family protein
MRTVDVHEAKTHFSRLLDDVAKGEEIVIAKAGRPVAKVVPLDKPVEDTSRRIGFMRGEFNVPDDFDAMFDDEIVEMSGPKD